MEVGGLLPTPTRTARGRGRGRTSDSYPEGTADRAACIAELVTVGIPLRDIALHLFVRGHDVDIDVLVRACRVQLQSMRSLTAGQEDPADAVAQRLRAGAKRSPVGRAWIRRARTYGARRGSDLEDALVALTSLWIGQDKPSDKAIAAFGHIFGTSEAECVASSVADLHLDHLDATLDYVSIEKLKEARALYWRIKRIVAQIVGLQKAVDATPLGVGLEDHQLLDWRVVDSIAIIIFVHILAIHPNFDAQLSVIEAALNQAEGTS